MIKKLRLQTSLSQQNSFSIKRFLRTIYLVDCFILLAIIGALCTKLPGIYSKAIGLTENEWVNATRTYDPGMADGVATALVDNNNLLAEFYHNKLWYLTIQPLAIPITVAQAKKLALSYMPGDAKFVKEYIDPTSTLPTYVYKSIGITLRFNSTDQLWTDYATEGQILVSLLIDHANPDQVFSIDVIVGSEKDIK